MSSAVPTLSAGIVSFGKIPSPMIPAASSFGKTVVDLHRPSPLGISIEWDGILTSRSHDIGPDAVRHEVRRHVLHQKCRCRLTLAIRVASRHPSVETADAARGNHLAFLLHVSFSCCPRRVI